MSIMILFICNDIAGFKIIKQIYYLYNQEGLCILAIMLFLATAAQSVDIVNHSISKIFVNAHDLDAYYIHLFYTHFLNGFSANTKHLYTICTMLNQRRGADVVQMLYKCFVFAGLGLTLNP